MTTQELKVKVTFIEPLLGSASGNPELHEEFIAAKAPTIAAAKEELEATQVPGEIDKASTVFAKDENGIHLWDYQCKGFLKEAVRSLIELGDCPQLTPWSYKKAVGLFVHVFPRRIYILQPSGKNVLKPDDSLSRPIRCETMQGERIALARSELVKAGCSLIFTIKWLAGTNKKSKQAIFTEELIHSALDYGNWVGIGQWRTGGFGRFTWEAAK